MCSSMHAPGNYIPFGILMLEVQPPPPPPHLPPIPQRLYECPTLLQVEVKSSTHHTTYHTILIHTQCYASSCERGGFVCVQGQDDIEFPITMCAHICKHITHTRTHTRAHTYTYTYTHTHTHAELGHSSKWKRRKGS